MAKKIEELEQEIARLEQENERLDMENVRLLGRNLLMSEQLNCWYELKQRVNWLKAEMQRGRRLSMQADMVDDAELLAMLENRLEQEPKLVTAEFGTKELAELRKNEILFSRMEKGRYIHKTWFYDFINKAVVPIATICAVVASFFFAADIFEMTEHTDIMSVKWPIM